ncbi:hypothetical protein HPP92_010858 [Vanilla planifolia]|uniref:EF-hand domain-containing protein n=1 Tax=Vanilla planifolia TaxID=51239 RepID=A0A835R1P4_VANPL|nr:hypothetical protein HPP92_010858 [Vanilla planifolia]
MGSASSLLTQYDIEEVQENCNYLFSQQEIVALYERFCQLDRNAKGFISADEFLSIPEFSLNPLSQRLLKITDGLNFKDFVAFFVCLQPKSFLPAEDWQVLVHLLNEAGYTRDASLLLDDFIKILSKCNMKMEVEVPVD